MSNCDYFPGIKPSGRETDNSLTTTEVKNKWCYTSTTAHAFKVGTRTTLLCNEVAVCCLWIGTQFLNTVAPGYNNIGIYDTPYIASHIVVPINSLLLTITLFCSVITIHNIQSLSWRYNRVRLAISMNFIIHTVTRNASNVSCPT
jgi:hypothetical protein